MSFFSKKPAEPPQNIDEVLAQFQELRNGFKEVLDKLSTLEKTNFNNVQKVGVVRFNPFSDQGGNQSFSCAILDGNNNGVVITSLFTRDGNRVYGKPIKLGNSGYKLTEEETKAIQSAQDIKTATKNGK